MRRKFTLIEMLVVIAIISILASMLSPSLRRSLASAYAITCKNNLRQCGLMFMEYASNNHGIVAGGATVNRYQIGWAAQYFSTVDSAQEYIRCPLGPAPQKPLYHCYGSIPQVVYYAQNYGSDGTRYYLYHNKPLIGAPIFNGVYPWSINTNRLRSAGTFMFLTDSVLFREGENQGMQMYHPHPTSSGGGLWFRHNMKINLLFSDWHVGSATNESFQEKVLTANGAFDRKSDGYLRNFITNGWLRTEDYTQHYVTY